MLACTNISDRHNVIFGTDDLNHDMLKGAVMDSAVMDSAVGRCANAIGVDTAISRLTGGMHQQSRGLNRIQSSMYLKTR